MQTRQLLIEAEYSPEHGRTIIYDANSGDVLFEATERCAEICDPVELAIAIALRVDDEIELLLDPIDGDEFKVVNQHPPQTVTSLLRELAEVESTRRDPVEWFDYEHRQWDAYELSVLRFLDTGDASAEEMSLMFSSSDIYEHLYDNKYIESLPGWTGYRITDKGKRMLAAWQTAIYAFWEKRFKARIGGGGND